MSKKTTPVGSTGARTRNRSARMKETTPIQFNWRKHWNTKVKPHLNHPCVQFSLDFGMHMVEPTWKPGDPPYRLGDDGTSRAKKGTLAWYQPSRQCHAIAFFAMAIGVINYPKLRWKFVSGRCHTVPVGYDENGQARLVLDILLFEDMTAEESIRFAVFKKGRCRAAAILRLRDEGCTCHPRNSCQQGTRFRRTLPSGTFCLSSAMYQEGRSEAQECGTHQIGQFRRRGPAPPGRFLFCRCLSWSPACRY